MSNRIVVITGAGGGLGYCLTERYLHAGDRILAMDYRISESLEALQAKYGEQLALETCDVSSQEAVQKVGETFGRMYDHVDVILNVAGIYRFADKVGLAETDLDADLVARMYNVNAMGPLRVVKSLWNYLRDGTVILNVSSEAGSIGSCWRKAEYSYCMSKAALNMGAKLLANELEGRKIRVINVHPGWMKTTMGGEDAMKSDSAITPEQAADDLLGIVDAAFEFPEGMMYMEHDRKPLPW